MTLALSVHDVDRIARVSRMLLSPGLPSLEQWWTQTSRALLELFGADHAMCILPGAGLLARHIDAGPLATIVAASAPARLRKLDPVYLAVNAASDQASPFTWNRVGVLRDAAVTQHRASPVYDAFRAAGIAESANIDFTTSHGRTALCVSFERTSAWVERSRLVAQLLAPSFEAGVHRYLLGAPNVDTASVLTPREREIAAMLVARRTNREIAGSLELSEHTVRHHIESIFAKLGVRSRREVAARLGVRG